MLPAALSILCFVLHPSALALARTPPEQPKTVSLCRALERLEPGDQIPVVVAGIYAVHHFYDPEEPACRLNVDPSSCIEFSTELRRPLEFDALHRDTLRVYATFGGILHGPELDPQIKDPTIPVTARLAAVSGSRYCASRYRTKLVVDSILEFKSVPSEVPWGPTMAEQTASGGQPYPLEMALPTYPPAALSLDIEGAVILSATVSAGSVTFVEIQFGDPVLVEEAVANVRTWRFQPDVNSSLTVEYDFRLEKRSPDQGENPSLEMRLPSYVRVVGSSKKW